MLALRDQREQRARDLNALQAMRDRLMRVCTLALREAPHSLPLTEMVERLTHELQLDQAEAEAAEAGASEP